MNERGLLALIEKSQGLGEYWLIDLDKNVTKEFKNSDTERLENNAVVFVDAQQAFTSLNLLPSPKWRVICLSTIKKLISKSIHETVSRPDFTASDEATVWCKSALAFAVTQLEKLDMAQLADLECRVIVATIAMEKHGLPFDKEQWLLALQSFAKENQQIKERLHGMLIKKDGFLLFGHEPIDLNSHQAVKEALENLIGQKLKSTGQKSLKEIDHEAARLVMEYREYARMESTYGEIFLSKITDRLRGTFTPIGSASGRFSCHEPNLLALPNHPAFQACIKPRSGREIIHFDYGAFELRILAALSGDEALMETFSHNQDIHSMVASRVFNTHVSKRENTHLRDQAKVLNFGIIYGMGEHALAQQLKISLSQAQSILKNYFAQFARVHEYLLGLESSARRDGYIKTALNRRGYIESDDFNPRVARNLPIQGTGADIVKLALCRVYQRLAQEEIDAFVVNVVHDELVVECRQDEKDTVSGLVKHEMEQAFSVILPGVPAEVSVK